MTWCFKFGLLWSVLSVSLAVLGAPRAALASTGDGGVADAAAEAGSAAVVADAGTSYDAPLRCGGALCDTTTGGTECGISGGAGARHAASGWMLGLAALGGGLAVRRRNLRAKGRAR